MRTKVINAVPELHQQGNLAIENMELIGQQDITSCDFGLQVAEDGRIWVCLNGIAWLRFKPHG